MKAGSINALIGANTAAKLTDVPMRAYREAELKGDKAGMEHAMGYMREFTESSVKYAKQAQSELIKERREEAKELEVKRSEALENTLAEKKQEREKAAKAAENPAESVTLGEAGKAALSAADVSAPAQSAAVYTADAEARPIEPQQPIIDVRA